MLSANFIRNVLRVLEDTRHEKSKKCTTCSRGIRGTKRKKARKESVVIVPDT